MVLFGSARAYTPTLNALAQMPLLARNGGIGSVRDPLPNALGQVVRSYHPTPADRARAALGSALQSTGQLPGEARAAAANVVGFSPLGAADDFNSGLLQTGLGLSQGRKGETLGGILAMALAGAPLPKPVKEALGPWERAELFQKRLAELGEPVGQLARSTNRYGEKSAYLDYGRGQLRFSDHDANMDFRPGQTQVHGNDPDEWLKMHKEAVARNDAEYAARKAAYEAADKAKAEKEAAYWRAKQQDESAKAARRKQFFADNGIDFAALRGEDRDKARAAFAAWEASQGR